MERLDSQIANKLCNWYQKNKRNLAWRANPSAYKVLVSEIMLQQTRVETVKKYYKNWMQEFPTLKSLAAAKLPKTLKLWEGLGYYKRCERLWLTARQIIEQFDGKIPDNKEKLLKLAGIGDYTASAICSLAYHQKIAAIDCNAKRVLSRVFFYQQNIQTLQATQFFEKKATQLLAFVDVKIFNQALMELGALICTGKNPKCEACPLQNLCIAKQKGSHERLPTKPIKKENIAVIMNYWILQNSKNELLVYHSNGTRWWSGLWVFPYFFENKKRQEYRFVDLKNNLQTHQAQKIGTLKHQVTKYKIQANYLLFTEKKYPFDFAKINNFLWVSKAELKNLALPVASRYACGLV